MTLPKIIALGGPTASGKSTLGRTLAAHFNGEIINVDSRQIYTDLTIGTAKDDIEKKLPDGTAVVDGIPHHLIDIIPPEHPVTLAQFKEMADERIQNILSRGKLPILVGGTGLYLDSLVYNFDLQKEKVQPTLRKKLQALDQPSLQEMLISLSPETFNEMTESDQKNPHRLMRAIERISQGKRVPYDRGEKKYKTLYLVISPDPDALEKNIRDRLHRMLEMGLEEENKRLRDRGLDSKSSPLNSIGYREFDDYFAGTQSLDETEALIAIHTRQYARRQMTWFKRNPDVVWVDGLDEAMAHVKPFLGKDRT